MERKYCFRKSDVRRPESGMKKKAGSGSQCSCRREISINAATVDSKQGYKSALFFSVPNYIKRTEKVV